MSIFPKEYQNNMNHQKWTFKSSNISTVNGSYPLANIAASKTHPFDDFSQLPKPPLMGGVRMKKPPCIYIYMYGWWFEPSWNMWVHPWEGCHPIYEMETSSIHVPNHHPDICMYIYVYIYIICMHISDFPFKILDLISKWTISPKKKMGKLSPWIYPSGASGGRLVFSDLMEFCCR